ncbi:MAG: hypothetical protein GY798_09500 [Hyphomicrobiales bacterium]|nr:hypothetical protein [Hyphomicrobiales bacterium]
MALPPHSEPANIQIKTRAFEQAAPLKDWSLPEAFTRLHHLLKTRLAKKATREYIQVLRLLETFELEIVHGAVKDALRLGAIGYDAVKHLVLCRIDKRPPRLDLELYPYLPKAEVTTTRPVAYMSLLGRTSECGAAP